MTATHALGLLGAAVTLVMLFEMLRHRRLREKYATIWIVVALGTLVVALNPGLLTWVSELMGFAVPANLLFFGASMLLLLVSIQHSYELSRLEERTRVLGEEVALLRLELSRHADDAQVTTPEPFDGPVEEPTPDEDPDGSAHDVPEQ